MNIIGKIAITMALLTTTPLLANCQYFQHLFDIDSSYDWGWNIIIKPDGTYFVEGGFVNPATNQWDEYNLIISADGESILNKHLFHFDGVNIYDGNSGEMKELPNGYYIIPLSEQIVHDTFYRGWAGLIKYNNFGDTIFLKTYTDTTTYFDEMIACAIMPDGGYMAGGLRAHDTAGYAYPGLIIRTDSLGDTLWTHTYQKFSNQSVQIFGIVPLSDGRIVVGANSERIKDAGAPHHYPYADFAPWFMILDSAGNIIRDTVYDIGFQGGGWIYKDMNDGYFTFGSYDSLFSDDPTADNNFPSFIAHLDTNFRITWITSFPYSIDNSHREKWLARQLKDSSYIILGERCPRKLRMGGKS